MISLAITSILFAIFTVIIIYLFIRESYAEEYKKPKDAEEFHKTRFQKTKTTSSDDTTVSDYETL